MNQNILKYLNNYSYDTKDVNRLLVSSFLVVNNIEKVKNKFIKELVITDKKEFKQVTEFIKLFDKQTFAIEELIELFEFVISPQDKEVNGAVFTPEYIRTYIVKNTIKKYKDKNLENLKFGDIACGCGGFFKTITEVLKEKTNKSCFEIFRDNIYGLDIQEYSIKRTKILLSLLAILNNEDNEEFTFNLFCGNALSFDWETVNSLKKNNGFDIIVGNPPYVGASKMDEETKSLLKNWSVSSSGKPDLYIPFFEIGMENLNENGVLGYITVNTFYRSLNGRSVRSYFSKNKFDISIIDFGGEQLFKKRSTYTCICIISKPQSTVIKYIKRISSKINKIKEKDYITIPYTNLDDFNGWYLINKKNINLITKIESCGTSLGEKFEIRNGFATLKNNIYVFNPTKESDDYFYLERDDEEFKIEKSICKNAIKPNTLKHESKIESNTEKLIFPYTIDVENKDLFDKDKRRLKILEEDTFKLDYPFAYQYLVSQKEILSQRDKGKKQYEKWYAFGRNQALTLNGYKLLLPYITNRPCFVYTSDSDLLFYNGYAILSNSIEELIVLQKILMSKIFWFYIVNTSKPYAGNYFSVAKNYIKNFGVCDLTNDEKVELLSLNNINEIDNFLLKVYNLQLD
ncbi:DNA methyltransferase [Lutibacter sp.]|uniref:Eco57I restriction-modification methylase domain-containing protein n=1 Tax=Lutibacter sp. TaxID=1925666 RepID=UPI0025BB4740|nr:DNA methyltransferase [Lutibacter sp.]MCF6182733.1 N-6 DNA methylase [Lutibacter sp.]